MAKSIIQVVIEAMDNDIASTTEFLISGSVKDFAEYREAVGRIRGLRLAVQAIKDLMRNNEFDDEND